MLLSRRAAHLRSISTRSGRSSCSVSAGRGSKRSPPSHKCQAQPMQVQLTYDLSWSDGTAASSQEQSAFDQHHPLPEAPLDAQAALHLLCTAASSNTRPSAAWLQRVCTGSLSSIGLPQLTPEQLCSLLSSLDQLGASFDPSNPWAVHLLEALTAAVPVLTTRQLSAALWSLSNMDLSQGEPAQRCLAAALTAANVNLQDFYSPDFAALLCALGSLGAQPPEDWLAAVLEEAEYQLVECAADFTAFDLARLASGLADMLTNRENSAARSSTSDGGGNSSSTSSSSNTVQEEPLQLSARAREALMTAVYARVRTMEEKGAVDFALSKLDANGKHSMHYDPRWTHEELKWLPRRVRDKNRIIKQNWVRSQWGGWS